jgi:hypothetical protein
MPRKPKDWGLDPETLERFLRLLDENRERAWERFGLLERKLALYFSHASSCDPNTLANRAIDIVVRKFQPPDDPEGRIAALQAFAFRVGRNVAFEDYRRRSREIAAEMSFSNRVQQFFRGKPDHDCLEWAFESLTETEKELAEAYYPDELPASGLPLHRKQLAKRLAVSDQALRKRVEELKKTLRSLYRSCCEKK